MPLMIGMGCEKGIFNNDNNSKLNNTSWKLVGYTDDEGVFEPITMPEQWKDTSYQVFFKEDTIYANMPNGKLNYGRYKAKKNGKLVLLDNRLFTDKSYGVLSDRFMYVLSKIYSYELSENDLKLNSYEINNKNEKHNIKMILKKIIHENSK